MAIKFFNIRSGETRICDTEPMIAAYYNSSNEGPNAQGGQDFGWRLAPETVARMREIQSDQSALDRIKLNFQLADEPKNTDILRWISLQDSREEQGATQEQAVDFERQYQDEIRAIEDRSAKSKTVSHAAPSKEIGSANENDSGKMKESKSSKKEN